MSLPFADRLAKRWWALPAVALLGACSTQVIVEAKFPTPLVESLPVNVGILIPEELYNYIYTEDVPNQSLWTIALGDANVAMLKPLFTRMFRDTRTVDAVPTADSAGGLDGVIEPTIAKFEFEVPVGQRDKFVEVWIQYQLTLYDADGRQVIEWPVSGYGKSELMHNRQDAVRKAAIVAMREAGATISTKFAEQPQVKAWLGEKAHATTAGIGPQAAVAPDAKPGVP
ncbi:MAG TPA: hypothetical protein VHH11_06770 [Gammaproteobacteria bacterium]|jgi:hypothetical protein|nr:hypothetical protein [Gammaproteobacteria bacterium]